MTESGRDDAVKYAAGQVRQRVKLVAPNWNFSSLGLASAYWQTRHNLVTMAIPDTPNMACPYFMPVEKLENGTWPHPSRLPLGSGWRGFISFANGTTGRKAMGNSSSI